MYTALLTRHYPHRAVGHGAPLVGGRDDRGLHTHTVPHSEAHAPRGRLGELEQLDVQEANPVRATLSLPVHLGERGEENKKKRERAREEEEGAREEEEGARKEEEGARKEEEGARKEEEGEGKRKKGKRRGRKGREEEEREEKRRKGKRRGGKER
ncbi:hypothetical protein FHG87_016515 [Trinorchestia longiramus]|nr:hypothetical protein FHG87_016515 [Trinorchestia longiramus]